MSQLGGMKKPAQCVTTGVSFKIVVTSRWMSQLREKNTAAAMDRKKDLCESIVRNKSSWDLLQEGRKKQQ
jgi:hypothetical protein